MPPNAESKLDPLTTDLWIASMTGPAHLYPAGSQTALCGREWSGWNWDVTVEKPRLANMACPLCEAKESIRREMPPESGNNSLSYVVECQTKPRGVWHEYFKWFKTKSEAQQWIEKLRPVNKQTRQSRYRVRIPELLRKQLSAKKLARKES